MNKSEVQSILAIADIHVERIQQALADIQQLFPLDPDKVKKLDKPAIFSIEVMTTRYSKLQDYLGTVGFNALFEIEGENTETWTMIDKLNKLEKYGIIEDSHVWRDMRKARNFLMHEYPDHPEIIAVSLNIIYNYIPSLLKIKNKLFACMLKDAE
jgi:uncharacterized protein with HEPN domain